MNEKNPDQSFWQRLVKFRVIQTLAIYIPAGWIAIEFLTAATETFGLPKWLPPGAMVLFLSCLPLVVYLAWVVQWTSSGISMQVPRRKGLVITAGLMATMMAATIGYYAFDSSNTRYQPPPGAGGAMTAPVATVAVLPLKAEDQALGKSFTLEITERLSRHPDLFVVSAESLFSPAIVDLPVPAQARLLDAQIIVTGEIKAVDKLFRAKMSMFDETGQETWSRDFVFGPDGVSRRGLQRRISQQVAERLGTRFPVSEYCEPTENLLAMDAYHEAVLLLHNKGPENLARAADLLKSAIDLDKDYAHAYEALGMTYLYLREPARMRSAMDLFRAALDRCAALGLAYKIWVPSYDGIDNNYIDQELQFRDALAMSPNNLILLSDYNQHLAQLGQMDAVRRVAFRNYRNNPLAARAVITYAWTQVFEDVDLALRLAARAEELGDRSCNTHMLRMVAALYVQKDIPAVRAAHDDLPEYCRNSSNQVAEQLVRLVNAQSDPELRLAELAVMRRNLQDDPNHTMLGAAMLRDFDLAFDAIEEGTRQGKYLHMIAWWGAEDYWSAFRRDTRFKQVVENAGMVEYWQAFGWPTGMCFPLGSSFICE